MSETDKVQDLASTEGSPSSSRGSVARRKSGIVRMPRRSFFAGGLVGLVAGKASEWIQPIEWTQRGLPDGTHLSFAQFGEDLVVRGLLEMLMIEKPSYLDIGAYEPIRSSNTYLFYRKGGRGVLVEPNVALVPKLARKRPGDVVLNAGIGLDDIPAADYFVTNDPQLNTFDREQVDRLVAISAVRVERVVRMPLMSINRVIGEHFGGSAPDFVSIDVEGLDLAILRTLDFRRFRPKVVCAETLITRTRGHNPDTTPFMAAQGYEVRGMTGANTIYVDRTLVQ